MGAAMTRQQINRTPPPPVTEEHRLTAFHALKYSPGLTYQAVRDDPYLNSLLEAKAHNLRTSEWLASLNPLRPKKQPDLFTTKPQAQTA
jgi:hypothetical protein